MTEHSTHLYDRLQQATAAIDRRLSSKENATRTPPHVGFILGSGLGAWADSLDNRLAIRYADIPHFPPSTVVGHAGQLVFGDRQGVRCVALQGRVHVYEGHSAAAVAFPARVLIALGARVLIVTNAAGGLNPAWPPGTLMIIRDHIALLGDTPLRGPNDERIGPRFPDMTNAYADELRKLVKEAATEQNIPVVEGTYAAMPGPAYETPAEVKMLQVIGADAVGMSTVPEVVVANHMGARVIGISCITNHAAGLTGRPLSHDEVTQTADRARTQFASLLDAVLQKLVQTKAVA